LNVALNPHLLAGSTALVVALLLLVVYFYRRRLFIVWGMGAWMLLAASMLIVSRSYGGEQLDGLAYGRSRSSPRLTPTGNGRASGAGTASS
jgi:peptidoglycan/LPS O-acetylase OafA/YrhL